MIDLTREKGLTLTTEQVTIIEDFAIQACNDRGFLSLYIFERALLVFASLVLYPDEADKIRETIGDNYDVRNAFDYLVDSGLADRMVKDYGDDLDYISEVGETWFEDVASFEHSVRGVMDSINTQSGNIMEAAQKTLKDFADNHEAQEVAKIAEKWGLNRKPDTPVDLPVDQELPAATLKTVKGSVAAAIASPLA